MESTKEPISESSRLPHQSKRTDGIQHQCHPALNLETSMIRKSFLGMVLIPTALAMAACSSDDSTNAGGQAGDTATAGSGGSSGTAGAAGSSDAGQEELVNLAATADAAKDFTTLLAAAEKAGLVDALKGDSDLTVLAPTDAAFATFLESQNLTLDDLSQEQIADILKYHIIDGKVLAADVTKLKRVTSLNGSDIAIEVLDGKVVLNGQSTVSATDIMATNGVIHVIDAVLLPTL